MLKRAVAAFAAILRYAVGGREAKLAAVLCSALLLSASTNTVPCSPSPEQQQATQYVTGNSNLRETPNTDAKVVVVISRASSVQVASCTDIARTMGLADDLVEQIRLAAPLHNIGMIGIPDEILGSEGSLSLEEMDQVRTHTSIGAQILGNSTSRMLQLAEEIALYHHEAWDGSGYTPGLSGESIPLAARIVAVADTYCAMIGNRPYRSAHSAEDAGAWIESQAGSRFDPEVVRAFKRVSGLESLPMLEST